MYIKTHPNANPEKVSSLIQQLTNEHLRDIPCKMHNNITHEVIETTVGGAIDLIEKFNTRDDKFGYNVAIGGMLTDEFSIKAVAPRIADNDYYENKDCPSAKCRHQFLFHRCTSFLLSFVICFL